MPLESHATAQVLDYNLQRQVAPHMALLGTPLPSIYYPGSFAAKEIERADKLIPGSDSQHRALQQH